MAAYASLVSVMNIIDSLHLHPHPPISLHPKQAVSLAKKVTFLQEFLEVYNPRLDYSKEADPLESRIADAAYAAEDTIESHIVDRITSDGGNISPETLYEALEKLIGDMDLIMKEAKEIQHTLGVHITKSTPSDSLKSSHITKENVMVGADDLLLEMKDKLTSGHALQIIPVVGMGGSGKTTLALNIYQDRLTKEYFHICAWATISQEYNIQGLLKHILHQLNNDVGQNLDVDDLGGILHKLLFGRRYLIVLDDMWSIKVLDGIRCFLPNNSNGSRIVVTTRLSNLCSDLPNCNNLEIGLLNEVDSWELLSKTVFGEEGCPPELVEIGKRIGKGCKGLPLSIVVIGGLLAKSNHTRAFWESIEENLNSVVNSEDDEHWFKILHMSYKQLPVYLKPCFLYMGVFGEDKVIRRSMLVNLWVSEGFLKPKNGKSLEEIAKEYLKELADRNLVLIDEIGINGEIKLCKIHDLLRDLCLREAKKESFYTPTPQVVALNAQRRIVISTSEDIDALSSVPLLRSLMWDLVGQKLPPLSTRLLRILSSPRYNTLGVKFLENLHELVNLRFLALSNHPRGFSFHRSIQKLWNLQFTTAEGFCLMFNEPPNIWYKPHIRHVKLTWFALADPPYDQDDIVLENLQTLGTVVNFKFSEHVVTRIPNIKKLTLLYPGGLDEGSCCINNLSCLLKLESLTCKIYQRAPDSIQKLIDYPISLKKLSLLINKPTFNWNDILDKIGELPFLQKLKLTYGTFKERQWKTTEGQFCSLKFLAIDGCRSLEVWTAERSHFPCLEQLDLELLFNLNEIPLDFAEIPTLRQIRVTFCSESVVKSAKKILKKQEVLYGQEAFIKLDVESWQEIW